MESLVASRGWVRLRGTLEKRCAYLVMDDPGDFVTDYHLSFDAMAALGWDVECVAWRDTSTDWDAFDAVYICTPWDYPDDPDLFMRVLESIDASSATLVNPISLVRWSLAKTYLRDLAERGGSVVPSLWFEHFDPDNVSSWFEHFASERIVIKPQVGTNSQYQFVLERPVGEDVIGEVQRAYRGRPFFVQPFIASIQSEGEYSLFFLGGECSHATLRVPEHGDFRSQEEHGAEVRAITASAEQVAAAKRILSLVDPQPTYVRVDMVRDKDGTYLLMELEMIEPSLYLRTDSEAAARFARAFDKAVSV